MRSNLLRLRPSDEPEQNDPGKVQWLFEGRLLDPDSLPYCVELWSVDRDAPEEVLALATIPALGFASYYAAMRSYPERLITLRLKGRVLTRSH
jgi:hypothetical protein